MASADLDFLFLQFLFQLFQQRGHIAKLSRVWFKEAAITSQNLLNPPRSSWLLWLSPGPPPQEADRGSFFPFPLHGLLGGTLLPLQSNAGGFRWAHQKVSFQFYLLCFLWGPKRAKDESSIHWYIHSFRKSLLRAYPTLSLAQRWEQIQLRTRQLLPSLDEVDHLTWLWSKQQG